MEHLAGSPYRNEPPARRKHHYMVAAFDVLDAVCREHNRASVCAHPVQAVDQVSRGRRVETAGRFVEEDDARTAEDFGRDVGSLALASTERVHGSVATGCKPERVHGLVHRGVDDSRRRGDPESGGVTQGAAQRQLAMENVILGNETDAVVVTVASVSSESHGALGRAADACQRGEQCALSRTAGPDDCSQLSGLDRETDAVESDGAVAVSQGEVDRPDPGTTNSWVSLHGDGLHGVSP